MGNRLESCKHLFVIIALLTLSSCLRDKNQVELPSNPNEQELITTLKLFLADSTNPNILKVGIYTDLVGIGQAKVDTVTLDANKTYFGEVLLLNEIAHPTDTISYEVIKEGDQHEFFYHVSSGLGMKIDTIKSDVDVNGVPIQIKPKVYTSSASKGSLMIILKHQGSSKPKTGMGDESIGDTDIEVSIPFKIQ
jgi:hypothetical protein